MEASTDFCDCFGGGDENDLSRRIFESDICLRYAMWHWKKYQEYIMRYLYQKRQIASSRERRLFRQGNRNWLASRRLQDGLREGCAACRKEAMESRSTLLSGPGDFTGQNKNSECDEADFDENMSDDERFQMDLDEEFKKFLEISEKHKEEREKVKRQLSNCNKRRNDEVTRTDELQDDIEYIDVCKKPLMPTEDAPKHVDKLKQHKDLYGDHAEKILCLEASLQMHFDKFCARNKPVYWPYTPLKF